MTDRLLELRAEQEIVAANCTSGSDPTYLAAIAIIAAIDECLALVGGGSAPAPATDRIARDMQLAADGHLEALNHSAPAIPVTPEAAPAVPPRYTLNIPGNGFTPSMREFEAGEFVRYRDYKAVEAQWSALLVQLRTLRDQWRADNSAIHRKYTDAGVAKLKCADELDALLPGSTEKE